MKGTFHISIGVRSLDESVSFFVDVLGASVSHRDISGYVNLDLCGNEITLKPSKSVETTLADFHFGINLKLEDFEVLASSIMECHRKFVKMEPKWVDANTPIERKKMYLQCPTGYLIELKGYRK